MILPFVLRTVEDAGPYKVGFMMPVPVAFVPRLTYFR